MKAEDGSANVTQQTTVVPTSTTSEMSTTPLTGGKRYIS